jgi:hypothetical protein
VPNQHADPPHTVALLCIRRERPRRRAPEPRDAASLDHLVGGGQQRFRDGEAEGFGGLEVDD